MSLRHLSSRAPSAASGPPASEATIARFTQAVEHALSAVLADSEITFSAPRTAPSSSLPSDTSFFASIGFAGPARGTMVLVAEAEVVAAMSPPDVREMMVDEAFTQDVVGELANLSLGRLKNQLLACGVTVMVAVPTTGCGTNLRFARAGASVSQWMSFDSRAGTLHFRIDADLSSCPPLRETPDAAAAIHEGELVLF